MKEGMSKPHTQVPRLAREKEETVEHLGGSVGDRVKVMAFRGWGAVVGEPLLQRQPAPRRTAPRRRAAPRRSAAPRRKASPAAAKRTRPAKAPHRAPKARRAKRRR